MLGRAGRFRPVHESLEVKVVVVGEGGADGLYCVPQLGGGRASAPAP